MGPRRRTIALLLTIVLVAAGVYIVDHNLRTRMLMSRATLVVRNVQSRGSVEWVDDRHLRFLRWMPRQGPHDGNGVHIVDYSVGSAERIAGRATDEQEHRARSLYRAVISPDRTLALIKRAERDRIEVVRIQDLSPVNPPVSAPESTFPGGVTLAWDRAGSAWFSLACEAGGWRLSRYKLRSNRPKTTADISYLTSRSFDQLDLAGVTSEGYPVIARTAVRWIDSPVLEEFIVLRDAADRRYTKWHFDRPPGADWSEGEARWLSLSPRGDRLAWIFAPSRQHSTPKTWLDRLFLFLHPPPAPCANIWTSDITGRGWHLVGGTPPTANDRWGGLGPRAGWTPSGSKIVFEYSDNLYTVDAD